MDPNETFVEVEPKLLRDVFGKEFFRETSTDIPRTEDTMSSPKEPDEIERRRERLHNVWNKKKTAQENEDQVDEPDNTFKAASDQTEPQDDRELYCVNDGNQMRRHVTKGGQVIYKCSLCQGTRGTEKGVTTTNHLA